MVFVSIWNFTANFFFSSKFLHVLCRIVLYNFCLCHLRCCMLWVGAHWNRDFMIFVETDFRQSLQGEKKARALWKSLGPAKKHEITWARGKKPKWKLQEQKRVGSPCVLKNGAGGGKGANQRPSPWHVQGPAREAERGLKCSQACCCSMLLTKEDSSTWPLGWNPLRLPNMFWCWTLQDNILLGACM